ncbi:hypothetical protein M0804_004017 [Polistes exclamans]|nr:hypothetical protein M0804_004017 [Polistes exclamans]
MSLGTMGLHLSTRRIVVGRYSPYLSVPPYDEHYLPVKKGQFSQDTILQKPNASRSNWYLKEKGGVKCAKPQRPTSMSLGF